MYADIRRNKKRVLRIKTMVNIDQYIRAIYKHIYVYTLIHPPYVYVEVQR